MTKGIYVNRMDFELDYAEFDKCFTIVQANYGDYKIRKSAVRLLVKFEGIVRSIKYEYGGGKFYILCEKNEKINEMIDALNKLTVDDSVFKVPVKSVDKIIVLELLNIGLNAIPISNDEDMMRYSNMEGSLFTFDSFNEGCERITALRIKYRNAKECTDMFGDLAVSFEARSFCNTELKDRMRFRRGTSINDYLKYVPTSNGNMKLYDDSPLLGRHTYIQRGCRGIEKASIPFFDFSSVGALDKSKMGRLNKSVKKMIRSYPGIIVNFNFVRTTVFDKEESHIFKKTGDDDDFLLTLKALCQEKRFCIIDMVKNDDSEIISDHLIDDFRTAFGIDVKKSDLVKEDHYNFVILLKDKRDENHRTYADIPVQHLAVSRYRKDYVEKNRNVNSGRFGTAIESRLTASLVNLLIKGDVQNNSQTFFNWTKNKLFGKNFDRDWYFIDRPRIQNPNAEKRMEATYGDMVVMKMTPFGDTSYKIYKAEEPKELWLEMCWSQFNKDNSSIKGVISDSANIYALVGTDVVMIPEIEATRNKLRSNPVSISSKSKTPIQSTSGIRSVEGRAEYLKACTDIRCYHHENGDCFYFVGTRGDGMQTKLQWAANLHKVKMIAGDEPFPTGMFKLMLVPFVKNMSMTTTPYPFKYLHEFERMHGMEEYKESEDDDYEGGEKYTLMTLEDYFDM